MVLVEGSRLLVARRGIAGKHLTVSAGDIIPPNWTRDSLGQLALTLGLKGGWRDLAAECIVRNNELVPISSC